MDRKDKLQKSLEKNLPVVPEAQEIKDKKDIKDDYEFSRRTYKDLINTGMGCCRYNRKTYGFTS